MPPENLNVHITKGLQGLDVHIDLLSDLFEESQTVTVETANPVLDLFSFVQDCTGFWVIDVSDGTSPNQGPFMNEWPLEEYTNSLGFLPSNPTPSVQPMPTDLEGTDSTLIEPFTVGPGRQERFSNFLDNALVPSTSNSNTRAKYNPTLPLFQGRSCTVYPGDYVDQLNMAQNIAGFVYLVPSSAYPNTVHFEEYSIGIILSSKWRGKGVAEQALYLALDEVFLGQNVHRVQALLIDCYKNDKALTLFTRMGFSHEGTRRQGFRCPLTAEWKDVTTLALLVTDWFVHIRNRTPGYRSASQALWDTLFARHQREREELLRWEDKLPRRSPSLETIRDGAATPIPGILSIGRSDASDSEICAPSEGETSEVERPKRKLFEIGDGAAASDAYDASSSEYDSEYESAVEGSPPKRLRSQGTDPSPLITTAQALETIWSLPRTPTDNRHRADSTSPITPISRSKIEPEPALAELSANSRRNHENAGDVACSPSPEPREGSVAASVPPSEFESDSDLEDYATSSSTDSSSPSGWEIVDDDLTSSPYTY